MTDLQIGAGSVGLLVLLIYGGLYVPLAFILVSFIGVLLVRGSFDLAASSLAIAASDSISDYTFAAIPIFVLMGLLVILADMGRSSFAVANQSFRRVPGGLGVATVAANAVFAATIGVGVASATIFTKLAVPEMVRYGYSKRLAVGIVAASSLLGPLIPPSLLFILFGVLTNTSIGSLFVSGILPGITLACAYGLYIVVGATLRPAAFGGVRSSTDTRDLMSSFQLLMNIAPISLLVAVIFVGLYGGVFTANEAGAVGASAALVFALFKNRNPKRYWQLLTETGQVTSSLLLLIVGANIYTRMLTLTGLSSHIGQLFTNWHVGLYGFLAVYVVIILLLGTLIDSASIMLLIVPLALPVFMALHADLVWIGVVTTMLVEVGLLTPPFGMAAFVIRASGADQGIQVGDVFSGAAPFALITLLVAILVIACPWLATALL
jgi:C4-dicarboxylate transporter, DctM subunit